MRLPPAGAHSWPGEAGARGLRVPEIADISDILADYRRELLRLGPVSIAADLKEHERREALPGILGWVARQLAGECRALQKELEPL